MALSLERANQAIMPTERIGPAAYWVDAGDRAHLRWVRAEPEEKLLYALARLSARGELGLGEGSRYAGSFRAHGVLVPVWDLDREQHAREWTKPAEELGTRLDEALASLEDDPPDQRRTPRPRRPDRPPGDHPLASRPTRTVRRLIHGGLRPPDSSVVSGTDKPRCAAARRDHSLEQHPEAGRGRPSASAFAELAERSIKHSAELAERSIKHSAELAERSIKHSAELAERSIKHSAELAE